jgi:succinate dehydrogenase/fumarate reductase cytochrome b subunit
MSRAKISLPRVTTRQSETMLYGAVASRINRWSGIMILAYLSLHLVGQAILNVREFRGLFSVLGFLAVFQYEPWVRAILFSSIMFHLLFGVYLIALDLGVRLRYRISILAITALATLTAIWELLPYVRG